ncbi:hypothetical protein BMAPRL20_1012 [Burkholderia mallei PRL-20]|nr:hypothetical protein BMAPRL20_1012 [Burkholderia mallei PRL-20]
MLRRALDALVADLAAQPGEDLSVGIVDDANQVLHLTPHWT